MMKKGRDRRPRPSIAFLLRFVAQRSWFASGPVNWCIPSANFSSGSCDGVVTVTHNALSGTASV